MNAGVHQPAASLEACRREGYLISTDNERLQMDVILAYLAELSYWARGRSRATMQQAIDHSLCFGVYHEDGRQVGFARVVTDYATFAYLCDLFILPEQQGRGLGKWLLSCILAHPGLQTVGRWTLYTKDAHTLYGQFGFVEEPDPRKHMVLRLRRRDENA